MKLVRKVSVIALAFMAAMITLSPTPAFGQHTRLIFATDHGIWVPATDQQIIRVTVGNPYPANDTASLERNTIELTRVKGDPARCRIAPGEAYTFTIDPRTTSQVVNSRTGLRLVEVTFRVESECAEDRPAPHPSITIELVHARTGDVESFQSFPGFTGGVRVATGDNN
jgi:hypothetical protein